MTIAFKCDRCEQFFEGYGIHSVDAGTAWQPKSTSRTCVVHLGVHWIGAPDGPSESSGPTLCSNCILDMVLLAVREERLDLSILLE